MLDVHMIDSGKWPLNLELQAERIKHPLVTLQAGTYVKGNLLEARWLSYSKGTNPYVTFIDDDDEVLDTSWITDAIELLESDPGVSAVFPRWEAYQDGKLVTAASTENWSPALMRRSPPDAHHLTIMRRENVMSTLEFVRRNCALMTHQQDIVLMISMMQFGRLHKVQNLAYRWNLHHQSARTMYDSPEVARWARGFKEQCLGYQP
jgi:hypothetical protein